MEIDTITYIKNPSTNTKFEEILSQEASQKTITTPSGKAVAFTNKFREVSKEITPERQKTVKHLRTFVESYSAIVDGANVVPVFCPATSFDEALNIGNQNFKKSAVKNEAYYGDGFSFSQYPHQAIRLLRNNPVSDPVLVLNWVALGHVYSATEEPSVLPSVDTLTGKPCKNGYDSHFVILIPDGLIDYPVGVNEEPTADEVVIFALDRILPKYIYTLKKIEPLEVGSNYYCLLWVSDKIIGESSENKELIKTIQKANVNILVFSMGSTAECLLWLHRNYVQCASPPPVRIITTRSRRFDSDNKAGIKLMDTLRGSKESRIQKIPILLFCSSATIDQVKQYHNPSDGRYISQYIEQVFMFGTFQEIRG